MKINFETKSIEISKTFANKAAQFGSEQYKDLQMAMRDLPGFRVVVKAPPSPCRTYTKGLTYAYMAQYINKVDEDGSIMRDFMDLRLACSYPEIKNWFLEKFPEINNFAA